MDDILFSMRRSSVLVGSLLTLLFLAAALIWSAAFVGNRSLLSVSFLDVGQGDAIFIDAPRGPQALIDGGAGTALLRELAREMPWWDRSLDIIIATHPDMDHIGGLIELLPRYRVGTIVVSSVEGDTDAWDTFIDLAEAEGARIVEAMRGQSIELGDARITILFPDRPVPRIETNTGSIVARLEYGETAFVLSGDSPSGVEEYLASLDAAGLRANVLKAGHHGSKTSSSPIFIGYVQPEYAVFSRGCDNRYGHPDEEVKDLYARFGIPTLDTCTGGTVTFVSDGQTVTPQ